MERNLDFMQSRCHAAGVGLRAHGKMHKCSALAKLQTTKGAVGICAQTMGEAEAFAEAGVPNLLVTSPVSLEDAPRVARLAKRMPVAAVVDDPLLVAALGSAARRDNIIIDLLVDIDLGQHRTGVHPGEVARLAQVITATPGAHFAGVQGYLGHLQHIEDARVRAEANERALRNLKAVIGELRAGGLGARIVTGGGTGTHTSDLESGVFTEIQAGSYALMDAEYQACQALGDRRWPFEAALFLATTVVSARHRTHVTVDAGVKSLSTDTAVPRVIAGAPSGSIWMGMGDEHGAIVHPLALNILKTVPQGPLAFQEAIDSGDAKLPELPDAPKLGDTIWLQPGHCDPTINLHDAFLVLEHDRTWSRWPIDARRKVPPMGPR